jgi:uncharacterized membrane protein YphA (DoxX/SURF4 family)
MNPKHLPRILFVIRLILGITFLLSGIGKLINSEDARYLVELMSMEFYWLIEYQTAIVLSITIAELILAFLLLTGKFLRLAFTCALLLLIFMISVIGFFQFQDISFDSCGCFGVFDILTGPVATLVKNIVLGAACIAGIRIKMALLKADKA